MLINKDTKIFCSFSQYPGNNGCKYFNERFDSNNVNAIYKSFYSNDIKRSIEAVKSLGISGFAVSMPYKVEVLNYIDQIDRIARIIGSCNTVLNKGGKLIGYNTDWIGIKNYLILNKITESILLAGNGGFSKAAQFTFNQMKIPFKIITRKNWSLLDNTDELIFNATPVDIDNKKNLIDARPNKSEGKIIARFQAEEQYKLYMHGD